MSRARESLGDCTRALRRLLEAVESPASAESVTSSSEQCAQSFTALTAELQGASAAERRAIAGELHELRRFTALALDAALRGKTRTGERLCEARRVSRDVAGSRSASGLECDVAG